MSPDKTHSSNEKLQEKERLNSNKKPGDILIRSFKRGKPGDPIYCKQTGQQISKQDHEFQQKNVDFTRYEWPSSDIFDFQRKEVGSDKMLKLKTYRYPSQMPDRKGVVQFVCGYGDYVGRFAYFAEEFSKQGYDFIGIDQRGLGRSEGSRGHYEDIQTIVDDQLEFSYKYDQHFN